MAANKFKPGDKVIAIRNAEDRYFDGKYKVQKDTILTVRVADVNPNTANEILRFEEITLPLSPSGSEFWYTASDFALYNPPRERIIYVAETLRDEVTCETKREVQHN